ncbi:cysteine desulfurase-like protein [Siminovitchia fortis]|uniref:cysteine desulfurase-like protein n=1 Tax=Siminovitchia fortis TaxID=254758 RepID=UPI0013E3CC5E|nr:cysteine desulfurase-like protein [Siminovitchia fortis]WHY81525.1 cysteine desulfurase-like protein [Siminovitchia fortis]
MQNIKNKVAIANIREQFPALNRTFKGKQVVYFDGPGGTQMCKPSIKRIMDYIENGMANRDGLFPTSEETEAILAQARAEVAVLINGYEDGVFFGANMTSLAYAISRMIARDWKAGEEIVVTEMDHSANVDPWVQIAEDKGMTIQRIPVNVDSLTLDRAVIETMIHPKTKAVFLGLASNGVGTINNVKPYIEAAKAVGALTVIDAVQAIPHIAVDQKALGADLVLGSGYKVFGPHIGFASMNPDLFSKYKPYKLIPAHNEPPSSMETGTQNHEGIAGMIGAVEFIESIGKGQSKRQRIINAYQLFEEQEHQMASFLKEEISKVEGVKMFIPATHVPSTPTISFVVDGVPSSTISKYLADEHAIFAANGHFYAYQLAKKLDVMKYDGWLRVGLSPYNTLEECERFIDGLKECLKTNL